jgi:hypothetical protein
MCKVPTTRLGAKPNRNEQGSVVVGLRYAAAASAGCTELNGSAPEGKKNGNFRRGARTKEAASASRYINSSLAERRLSQSS